MFMDYFYEAKKEMILSKTATQTNQNILDAGCGRGNYIQSLSPRTFAVGIDLDKRKINSAMRGRMDNNNSHYAVADAAHLPLRDSIFGGVLCLDVLHMPDNYELIVREMLRCLGCDGSLVLAILNDNFPPFDLHNLKAWINRKRNRPVRFTWQAYDYEPRLFDRKRVIKLLEENRVGVVNIYFFGVVFAFMADYFCYVVHRFFRVTDDKLLPIAKAGIALDMKMGNWSNASQVVLEIKQVRAC